MATLNIEPAVIPGEQNEYSPDSRSGNQQYLDGAGNLHVFSIGDFNGAAPPGQDIFYMVVPAGTNIRNATPQKLGARQKVYSVDLITVENASTFTLRVQINDAQPGQPSMVNPHWATVSGVSIAPVQGGGGNGSGVSLADVQAWLVHQMGLTG